MRPDDQPGRSRFLLLLLHDPATATGGSWLRRRLRMQSQSYLTSLVQSSLVSLDRRIAHDRACCVPAMAVSHGYSQGFTPTGTRRLIWDHQRKVRSRSVVRGRRRLRRVLPHGQDHPPDLHRRTRWSPRALSASLVIDAGPSRRRVRRTRAGRAALPGRPVAARGSALCAVVCQAR